MQQRLAARLFYCCLTGWGRRSGDVGQGRCCLHACETVCVSVCNASPRRTHTRTNWLWAPQSRSVEAHNVTTPPLLIRVCVASRVDRFWPQRPPQGVYMVCANPYWIFGYTSATITVQYTGSRLLSRSWGFSSSTPGGRGSCATFSIGTAGLVRGSGWGDPHYRLLDGRYV
jgi:hypothetical protein